MTRGTIIGFSGASALALIAVGLLTLEYFEKRKAREQFEHQVASGQIVRVGFVAALEGDAGIRSSSDQSTPLGIGDSISVGDVISTGPGSRLLIRLHDESEVRLGEDSEMVIESYMFDPAVASRNSCSMNLVRGAFRVLTKGITDLNPERFEVKTRLATIGIRGCEVGFTLAALAESVYVLDVSDEVEVTASGPNQVVTHGKRQKSVTVHQPGYVVRIDAKGNLNKEATDPNELAALLSATTVEARDAAVGDDAQLQLLYFSDITNGDAGDMLTINARLLHTPESGGTATNVTLRQFIHPLLRFTGTPVQISGPEPIVSTGRVTVVTNTPAGRVTNLLSAVDFVFTNYFSVTNEPINFTYNMHLADAVRPHQILTNNAHLLWNRKDEPPAEPDAPPPVYTNRTRFAFTVDRPPQFTVSITDSTRAHTMTSAYDPLIEDVEIEEEVTFFFTGVLSEGSMPVTVTVVFPIEVVPDPLDMVSARFVSAGNSIRSQILPPEMTILDTDEDDIRDTVIFRFGETVNAGDNRMNEDDELRFMITARVVDSPANRPAARWTVTGLLDYGGPQPLRDTDDVELFRAEEQPEDEVIEANFRRDPDPEVVTPEPEPTAPDAPPPPIDDGGGITIIVDQPDDDGGGSVLVTDPPLTPNPPPPAPPPTTRPRRPPAPPEPPDEPELPPPPPDIPDPGTTPAGP